MHLLFSCDFIYHNCLFLQSAPQNYCHLRPYELNAIYRETKFVGMKCSTKRIDRAQNQLKPTITNQATFVLWKQVETTPLEIWSVY